jgi:hypothetical protein
MNQNSPKDYMRPLLTGAITVVVSRYGLGATSTVRVLGMAMPLSVALGAAAAVSSYTVGAVGPSLLTAMGQNASQETFELGIARPLLTGAATLATTTLLIGMPRGVVGIGLVVGSGAASDVAASYGVSMMGQ